MPKDKEALPQERKPLLTLWDATDQVWRAALNHEPHRQFSQRQVANFVDKKQKPLSLDDIEQIRNVLLAQKEFKEINKRNISNQNRILTQGKPKYGRGYLSAQILNFMIYGGAALALIQLYFRGIEFPPYNATEEQTKDYQETIKVQFRYALGIGLGIACFSWLTSTLSRAHMDTEIAAKETHDFIKAMSDDLYSLPEERNIKEQTIKKIEEFFKAEENDIDLNQDLKQINHNPQSTNWHHSISHTLSYTMNKVGSYYTSIGKHLRRNHYLPEKTIDIPTTLRDWLIFALDDLNDLNAYTDIYETLQVSDNGPNINPLVLDLMKIALDRAYPQQVGLNQDKTREFEYIQTIHALFKFANELPILDPKQLHPLAFTLHTFTMILRNTNKLHILHKLILMLHEANDNGGENMEGSQDIEVDLYKNFIVRLESLLAGKSKSALSDIHQRLITLNEIKYEHDKDNTGKEKNPNKEEDTSTEEIKTTINIKSNTYYIFISVMKSSFTKDLSVEKFDECLQVMLDILENSNKFNAFPSKRDKDAIFDNELIPKSVRNYNSIFISANQPQNNKGQQNNQEQQPNRVRKGNSPV